MRGQAPVVSPHAHSAAALNLLRELLRGYYVGVTRNALRAARNRHVIGLLRARYVHVIRFA